MSASYNGHVEAIQVLIEKGALIEAADKDGNTSLIWAASQNGHVEAMRVLIEKGALIEAATEVRIHSHATTHARSQTLITHACNTGLRTHNLV